MPYNLLYQSALAKLIGKVVALSVHIIITVGLYYFFYLIAGLINSNN